MERHRVYIERVSEGGETDLGDEGGLVGGLRRRDAPMANTQTAEFIKTVRANGVQLAKAGN